MISSRLQRFIISALLAVAVIALYAPVTGYDFIALDDAGYVSENANINSGFSWAGIKWILENPVGGNWHPVTMLSHMLDCQVYGLYPGGHHFTNVLIHLANTLLLFWVLLAITKNLNSEARIQKPEAKNQKTDSRPLNSNLWPCALVAALFGLHPLHVESVAWIAERKDVLSGFFFLLTLWAYFNYAEKRKNKNSTSQASVSTPASASAMHGFGIQNLGSGSWYAFTLGFATLGLMSKPMLVTLPFVLLLLDYWPLNRLLAEKRPVTGKIIQDAGRPDSFMWLIIEKLPLFVLAAIFSVITFFIQKSYGAVVQLEYLPLKARLTNIMISYADYLEKMFWPHPLAMLYPYRDWTTAQIAISTIFFLGLTLVAIVFARRRRYIFMGWFWFAGMLVPVIGIVQVGIQVTADRYTYLPSIGIFIALAWGLAEFAVSPVRRTLVAFGAILAVACLISLTVVQVHYWKNTETLFEHAVRVTGNNTDAHYMLGALFESQGKTSEAQSQFEQSLRDNPDNVKALGGLGYNFCCQGKFDEAAAEYRTALRIEPDSAKAHFGLAEVLRKQHKNDEAMDEYFHALQANPNLAEAHYQLAALFNARQDAASAILHLQKTVQLAPDWFLPINNLAWMLATESDPKLRDGSEALRLAIHATVVAGRDNPNALDTLAAAYAETGQFADAVATAQRAIQNADASGQTNLAQEIESRLKLYQTQQAYRE